MYARQPQPQWVSQATQAMQQHGLSNGNTIAHAQQAAQQAQAAQQQAAQQAGRGGQHTPTHTGASAGAAHSGQQQASGLAQQQATLQAQAQAHAQQQQQMQQTYLQQAAHAASAGAGIASAVVGVPYGSVVNVPTDRLHGVMQQQAQQQQRASPKLPASTSARELAGYADAASLLGKRARGLEGPGRHSSAQRLQIPGKVKAVAPQAGRKSGVPGIVAPGPLPPDGATAVLAGASTASPPPWPVLPYLEAVDHLMADPAKQPLTFHRRVTRPVCQFVSAVAAALDLRDLTKLGAGMLFMRAMLRDDAMGRLAVYDTLQAYAERSDWSALFQCVCEYLDSAGFDVNQLFVPATQLYVPLHSKVDL